MQASKKKCIEIMLILKADMRFWGKYVEDFTRSFVELTVHERHEIELLAGPRLKYDFMCQIFEHAYKELKEVEDSEKQRILRWCFVALIFENFDFDYRETLLRASSLVSQIGPHDKVAFTEWSKVSNFASKKAKDYLLSVGWY